MHVDCRFLTAVAGICHVTFHAGLLLEPCLFSLSLLSSPFAGEWPAPGSWLSRGLEDDCWILWGLIWSSSKGISCTPQSSYLKWDHSQYSIQISSKFLERCLCVIVADKNLSFVCLEGTTFQLYSQYYFGTVCLCSFWIIASFHCLQLGFIELS